MSFKKFWRKIKKSEGKRNSRRRGADAAMDRSDEPNNTDEMSIESDDTLDDDELENSESLAFELEYLERDAFPEFDDVSVQPEDSEEGCDGDDKKKDLNYQMLAKKYETKECQDVAVFLALADRMSISSLLHVLQGHIRSSDMDIRPYAEIAKQQQQQQQQQESRYSLTIKQGSFAKPRPKKCRFAEVTDGQVRANIREVECLKAMKGLWWRASEMRTIQEELVETVQFFRKYRHDYTESVEVIAQKADKLPEEVVERHLKNLTKDNYTRGLESHIVKLLSENRKRTVRAVLSEQVGCRDDGSETRAHRLREQSLLNSGLSTGFAERMGRCDQIVALKASLSSW